MHDIETLIEKLTAVPSALAQLLPSVPETSLRVRPAPGAWCAAEVLQHLLDVEGRYGDRLTTVAQQIEPEIASIHPDESGYDPAISIAALLDAFAVARRDTVGYLQGLPAPVWQRSATHDVWGSVSFHYLVEHLLEHDVAHQHQLAALGQAS